ncbi:Uncharacterised protein [Klebsiella pneumoniae]|nr:Uncharacterised protein [Klebsiella pneumoniae]
MAGRADQLDPALRRLVIRLGADEGRQEAVVDVDHLVGVLAAQVRRQDLHVASQDDAVGAMFVDQPGNFIESRLLVLRIDGNVEIRDTVPLDHAAQVVVVGDHAGNLAVQFAAVPAVQQIGQAMGLLAGHQHHALLHLGIGDPPFHGEFAGDRGESLAEAIQVERQRVGTDLVAHEEPAVIVVGMMAGFGDPAIVGGQEVTHLGNDPDPVGTGDHQPKSAHGYTPETSRKAAILAAWREKFSLGEGLSTGCCARE